jgi:Abortive infection C-terminus
MARHALESIVSVRRTCRLTSAGTRYGFGRNLSSPKFVHFDIAQYQGYGRRMAVIMSFLNGLPSSPMDRAMALQELLIARATGGIAHDGEYQQLRRAFMRDPIARDLLPAFVRANRNLDMFWGWIKNEAGQYEPRRKIVRDAFLPLLDHLEGRGVAPADLDISTALGSFDEEGVHRAWTRALSRRTSDPEGAITAARTLLETVCKRVLDETSGTYDDKEDLPKLYQMVAERLILAPSQHTEPVFKSILGGCQNVVNSLGTLRNKVGDAHGRGGKPVRPTPRHAALAVNLAGAMATFLIETFISRKAP